jgi:hypothetical protein
MKPASSGWYDGVLGLCVVSKPSNWPNSFLLGVTCLASIINEATLEKGTCRSALGTYNSFFVLLELCEMAACTGAAIPRSFSSTNKFINVES